MAGASFSERQRFRLYRLGVNVLLEGTKNDRLALLSWQAKKRSQHAIACAYWVRAAAAVLADDVKITRLEFRLRDVA